MNTSAPLQGLRRSVALGLLFAATSPWVLAQPAPVTPAPADGQAPAAARPPALKDAEGRSLRRAARTGHITNYYEDKIAPYTLPDPLVLKNGQPVRDANTWFKVRRPEIIKMYEDEIYGRVPANVPKVTAKVVSTDPKALDGAAVLKEVELHFGDKPEGPTVHLHLYVPARKSGPVPMILSISFSGAAAPATAPAATPAGAEAAAKAPAAARPMSEPVADIIARGYACGVFTYTEIQPDRVNTFTQSVIGLTLAPGQTAPAPDEWGTISAWAWGLSRIEDYLETDRDIDAKRVAIVGHSRLGKTVLWAGAKDTRFAMVLSSQGGELGSALGRRDFGETIDDMAAAFGYQFAGNLQKYPGHWNDMPVDTHFLIACSAPRPVFVTGGAGNPWSDSKGEFLGMVAAGPVYRLLGERDLGITEMPPMDTPIMTGKLAYMNNNGPHIISPLDWKSYLDYADKYLKPAK